MKTIFIKSKNELRFTVGWILFGVCLFSLLLYGLSAILSKPTVETITTDAIISNSNNSNVMRDVKFQPKDKFRRR